MDRDDGGCPGGARIPEEESLAEARRATLCLLNAEREAEGLPPLAVDRRLQRAAQRHSRDMGERDFFAHDTPDGVTASERVRDAGVSLEGLVVAENLAWGTDAAARPREIVEGWMDSPGHRENILRPRLTHIGIGIAFDAPEPAGGRRAAVYTTDFSGPAR